MNTKEEKWQLRQLRLESLKLAMQTKPTAHTDAWGKQTIGSAHRYGPEDLIKDAKLIHAAIMEDEKQGPSSLQEMEVRVASLEKHVEFLNNRVSQVDTLI